MAQDQKRTTKTSAERTQRPPRTKEQKTKPKGKNKVMLMGFIEFHYDD